MAKQILGYPHDNFVFRVIIFTNYQHLRNNTLYNNLTPIIPDGLTEAVCTNLICYYGMGRNYDKTIEKWYKRAITFDYNTILEEIVKYDNLAKQCEKFNQPNGQIMYSQAVIVLSATLRMMTPFDHVLIMNC